MWRSLFAFFNKIWHLSIKIIILPILFPRETNESIYPWKENSISYPTMYSNDYSVSYLTSYSQKYELNFLPHTGKFVLLGKCPIDKWYISGKKPTLYILFEREFNKLSNGVCCKWFWWEILGLQPEIGK